jgi:hypothetical protein
MGMTRRTMTPLTLLLALGVLLLVGCSDGTEDASDDQAAVDDGHRAGDEMADGEAPAEVEHADEEAVEDAEAPAPGGEAGGDQGDLRPISATLGRRVIRTAEIELQVDDPDAAADEVMSVADRAGGFVATTDLRRDAEQMLRGTITLRVPSADLLEVLADLEDLAEYAPVSRIDERDVTTETADLEARLTNLSTYEQELRTLLSDVREDTSSPDDLLRIFERIREVRAEIDQIEGRLASLSDQVDLATVTVRIEPTSTALPVADPTWQPGETLHDALAAAARGLSRIADGAIWLAVGVLPVTAVVLAPIVVVAVAWRRLRRQPGSSTPTG